MFDDEVMSDMLNAKATGANMTVAEEILLLCMVLAPVYTIQLASSNRVEEKSLLATRIAFFATVGYWLVAFWFYPISGIVVASSLSIVPCTTFCVFCVAGEFMRKHEPEKTDEYDDEDGDDEETDPSIIEGILFTVIFTALLTAFLSGKTRKQVACTQLIVYEPYTPIYL